MVGGVKVTVGGVKCLAGLRMVARRSRIAVDAGDTGDRCLGRVTAGPVTGHVRSADPVDLPIASIVMRSFERILSLPPF